MAKALGSAATLTLSGDSGATYLIPIGRIKSIALPPGVTMVDATDNDSNGTKDFLPGDSKFNLSVTANADSADAGQIAIKNGFAAKTLMYVRYRPRVGTGEDQFIGQAYIEKAQIDSKHEAIQELMFDLQYTGGLTKSPQ